MFVIEHTGQTLKVSLSLGLLSLKLLQEFFIDLGRPVGGLVDPSPLFDKYFKLFLQMFKLFLKIILPLIIDNLIAFDSLREHHEDLFIPLTLLELKSHSI